MAGKYDVFLSYRRQGGESTAKILCDRLTDLGHRVFYDVESLRSGAFNTKLYSVIEECRDVVVVLSPDSLERCRKEDDWVRLEIAHALKTGRNVVPVFLRGFRFPETLPEDIEALRYQNGLEANTEFFDAFVKKLQSFLHSKPNFLRRVGQNSIFRRTVPLTLAILTALGIFLGVSALVRNNPDTFPKTQEQKNITSETLSYVEKNLTLIDSVFRTVSDAYKDCETYLSAPDPTKQEQAMHSLYNAYGRVGKAESASFQLPESLAGKIDGTPINKADLQAVADYNVTLCKSYQEDLLFFRQVIGTGTVFDNATQRDLLEIYRNMLNSDKDTIAYGINDLLLPIGDTYLEEFRQKFLPTLVDLPFGTQVWLKDKKEIQRLADSVYNRQQDLQTRLASILGSENYEWMKEKAQLEQYALENGVSREQIDAFLAHLTRQSGTLVEWKKQLDEVNIKLAAGLEQARVKFAPTEEDKPEILWGKMLRFLNLKLYDEAVKCAQMYQLKLQSEYPEVNQYVPAAIRFIDQISSTGVDYGVIVCAYEPGKPNHSVFEIGDIIIAVNDKICRNYNDFTASRQSGEGYKATFLRADKDGKLVFRKENITAGEPKIQLLDMTEKE